GEERYQPDKEPDQQPGAPAVAGDLVVDVDVGRRRWFACDAGLVHAVLRGGREADLRDLAVRRRLDFEVFGRREAHRACQYDSGEGLQSGVVVAHLAVVEAPRELNLV